MQPGEIERVRQLPEYAALTCARKKIVWLLPLATMGAYFALILAIAFSPAALGKPIGVGVTSVGVVLGLGTVVVEKRIGAA